MKRRNLLITGSVLSLILLGGFSAFYPAGAPAGKTGSPGDASSCASCHGTAATTISGWITSNIPAAGYMPMHTYQITATNSMTGTGKYGFEVSPQNLSGTLLGTLVAGTNSQLVGSGKYVTHTSASSSIKSWTFSWTAPAPGAGNVTFYGAFALNYTGATTLSTLTVSEVMSTGISDPSFVSAIVSPNPGNGQFKVTIPESMRNSHGTIQVLNAAGKPVYSAKYAYDNYNGVNIDISNLPKGVYFMLLQNALGSRTEKFMLK